MLISILIKQAKLDVAVINSRGFDGDKELASKAAENLPSTSSAAEGTLDRVLFSYCAKVFEVLFRTLIS
jgi:hypothetical protein